MDELSAQALEVRVLSGMLTRLAGRDLERRIQALGCDISISGLQFGVLQRIARGEVTISELSGRMLLTPPTLVPVIDALERKGLVQRIPGAQDRRRKELSLTELGIVLIRRLPAVADDDTLLAALTQLGAPKSGQLAALLRELVKSLAPNPDLVDHILADAVGGEGIAGSSLLRAEPSS